MTHTEVEEQRPHDVPKVNVCGNLTLELARNNLSTRALLLKVQQTTRDTSYGPAEQV